MIYRFDQYYETVARVGVKDHFFKYFDVQYYFRNLVPSYLINLQWEYIWTDVTNNRKQPFQLIGEYDTSNAYLDFESLFVEDMLLELQLHSIYGPSLIYKIYNNQSPLKLGSPHMIRELILRTYVKFYATAEINTCLMMQGTKIPKGNPILKLPCIPCVSNIHVNRFWERMIIKNSAFDTSIITDIKISHGEISKEHMDTFERYYVEWIKTQDYDIMLEVMDGITLYKTNLYTIKQEMCRDMRSPVLSM